MFCMREHGPELSKYLSSLVHDFVHAEFGQHPRAFILDVFHDSGGAVRKVQEYHFWRGVHCNTEYVIRRRNCWDTKCLHGVSSILLATQFALEHDVRKMYRKCKCYHPVP